MSKIDLYPGSTTTFDVIQQAVDNFDEVLLHARDKSGTPSLTFDLGPNRILVRKPVTIKGVPDPKYPDEKPVITGRSGYLTHDNTTDGYPGVGIFSIVTKGVVNLTNLHLKHTPDPNPLGGSMHGSATVAYFADNNYESNLTVTNCDIITAATSGISVDAINAMNLAGMKHEIHVEGCQIKGLDQPSLALYGAGNYIGVKLGAMGVGRPPIDMREGHFAVKRCTIDSAKWAGVAVAFFESDAKSKFDVSNNRIGCHPNSPTENTTVGIIFLNASVLNPALGSWAKGRINLDHNVIELGGYFDFPWRQWSAGILVQVNTDLPGARETTITNNSIRFVQSILPVWPQPTDVTELVLDGIIYQDVAAKGPTTGSVSIKTNTVVGNEIVRPLRGIWLHQGARGVRVEDNDLRQLMASHSQIFIGKEAHNCVVSGNHYGGLEPLPATFMQKPVAVVLCDGDQNRLSCTDFSGTGVPGWVMDSSGLVSSGGPGRVKLDANSEFDDVEVDPTTFAVTPGNTVQWWNASVMQPNNNTVHV